jgi:hypothetical protein
VAPWHPPLGRGVPSTNKMKSRGERGEPWGTPAVGEKASERESPTGPEWQDPGSYKKWINCRYLRMLMKKRKDE